MEKYESYRQYINSVLDSRTQCEQLSEECIEVAKAALKVIRALGYSNNYTPISKQQSVDDLMEELADMLMVLSTMLSKDLIYSLVDAAYNSPKWERWAKRLGYENKKVND